jgi:phosphatidylglycerophosphatase A
MNKLGVLIATFFGVGRFRVAPGTLTSLLVTLIVFLVPSRLLPFPSLALATAIVFVIGVPAAWVCERHFQKKDPRQCVIDEVAGQMISLLLLPRQIGFYVTAFLLFRFLDILKPFPIKKSEQIPYGIGIMLDDILAGLYTLIILQVVRYFFFK